jgi:hypothetical protein
MRFLFHEVKHHSEYNEIVYRRPHSDHHLLIKVVNILENYLPGQVTLIFY